MSRYISFTKSKHLIFLNEREYVRVANKVYRLISPGRQVGYVEFVSLLLDPGQA
jgi:hypothetical protein